MILLIQLILAYILGDFFLQPDKWVKRKKKDKLKSVYLYLHTAIHFVLILLVTGDISYWKMALVIASAHLVIDGIKLLAQKEDTARTWFFADQVLHLAIILVVWGFGEHIVPDIRALYKKEILIPLTAVLFLLTPSSIIIKNIISKWTPASGGPPYGTSETEAYGSLENAGQWIGMIERVLIVVFIFAGKWEGVGFLLAAKSIFRFGDLKNTRDTRLTEYVLIGTLLSFGVAIFAALITLKLLKS